MKMILEWLKNENCLCLRDKQHKEENITDGLSVFLLAINC